MTNFRPAYYHFFQKGYVCLAYFWGNDSSHSFSSAATLTQAEARLRQLLPPSEVLPALQHITREEFLKILDQRAG